MNLLFVGLGSIGKRHLRNAVSLLGERRVDYSVDALRSGALPLEKEIESEIRNVFFDYREITTEYDAAFITNTSAAHYETLKRVAPMVKAVFIEKPVFADLPVDIGALKLREDGVYYVACPLRRAPVVVRVKELLTAHKPTAVRALCSSYLPDWRRGDYRRSYSADCREGGGVRLDLIHEWDYILDLFGEPRTVASESGRFSTLEITSEDTASYLARYDDMLLTLHLDYTGRSPRRELELFCAGETIAADILKNELRYLRSGEKERFAPVDIHLSEMRYFLDLAVSGKGNINPVEQAVRTLEIALG